MPVSQWLERLSSLLRSRLDLEPRDDDAFHARVARPQRDLQQRLETADSGEIVGGVVELVGIADIRERLGPDWELVSAVVDDIATEELTRGLGPGDVYQKVDDGYLVCFETSSQRAAKRVANIIALQIERRLVEKSAIAGVAGEARTAKLSLQELRSSGDPVAAMQAALASERPAAGPRSLQPTILFQPAWPASELEQTQNRCVMDSVSGIAVARKFKDLGDGSNELAEALAELDCSLFAQATASLREAVTTTRAATILVPVHFHSLLGGAGLDLVTQGGALPPTLRRLIILDIIGVSDDATIADLIQAARTAKEATGRVIIQLHPGDVRFRSAMVDQLWGVSLNLGGRDKELSAQDLKVFPSYASELDLRSYAFGANTLGKAQAAADAGFDYIAGSAVHDIVPSPRPHSRFSPLFGDPTDRGRTTAKRSIERLHERFVPTDPFSYLLLADGSRHECWVRDASSTGAAVVTQERPDPGDEVTLGSMPARVVRHLESGIAIQFHKPHPPSLIESALKESPMTTGKRRPRTGRS